ncbi:hypothetical protein [Nocardia stercoris]|uniref:Uncharacterized protein n=1 Tax=Nocardia stercoris TaxID=2483361 RepID=A0A3M2LGI9_9NOCA|nr:hypothetical protein [Nocardia stercoris]RMI35065.1 hypothetical protein EBN03_01695 [Nocardia stercoris]
MNPMNLTVPAEVTRAGLAEFRGYTTLRSTWNVLAACAVFALVTGIAGSTFGNKPQEHGKWGLGTYGLGLYAAFVVTAVVAAVAGLRATSRWYRDDSLALAVLFTPDRDLLAGAKFGAVAVFSLLLGVVTAVGGTIGLLAGGRSGLPVGVLVENLCSGVLAAGCWGVIGASLGIILRAFGSGLVALVGWLVAEPVLWAVFGGAGMPGTAVLLPGSASIRLISVDSFPNASALAPTPAAAIVLLLWAAGLGAGAWWLLRTRDIDA